MNMPLYQPLPQSNTDSNTESEEELQSGQETQVITRQKPRLEVQIDGNPVMATTKLNVESIYVPSTNGFMPPVAIAKSSISTRRLSCARKFLFILSILLCLFTIAGFIWLLPCDIDLCPLTTMPVDAKSWETPLPDFELHGPAVAVPRAVGKGKNLVLLARNAISANPAPLRHRVLCLLGTTGDLAWSHGMTREPLDIDCSMLDVNKDGVLDCVVAGHQDLLKVIDPLSGISLWETSLPSSSLQPIRTQFPVLLPDVTGDGIRDLLTAWSFRDPSTPTVLLIVSGASGEVFGKPVPTPFCMAVSGLVLEKDYSVSYTCRNAHNKDSEQTMQLQEVVQRAGRVTQKIPVEEVPDIARMPDSDSGSNHEARVDGRHLLLENRGHCPSDCSVTIVVKDRDNRTMYNKSLNGVYAMSPVTLSFEKLTGFVLKLWQWHGRKTKRTMNGTTTDDQIPVKTAKGTTPLRRLTKRLGDDILMEVSERVLLITLNETDLHIVNVSQQPVVLLCRSSSICQPSAQALRRSLLIADLDDDGSKEIVSYSSSYMPDAGTERDLRLQSRVRVVRLEAELPKLYETLNRS